METEKKYFGGWFVWLLFLCIVGGVILTGLNYLGIIGKTIVEREVYTNSMQYKEARKDAVNIFEGQLIEIERKLSNPNLDEDARALLEAQAAGIRVQMHGERSKM